MPFVAGDKVVYPHHGATVIDGVETQDFAGDTKEYLVLHFADASLTLRVPQDQAGAVGLREVIDDDEVDDVLAVLRRRDVRMPSNWSRRYKNHAEMLKSGDVYQLAEVVRNLSRRRQEKTLSAGEQRMLQVARQNLVSELSLVMTAAPDEVDVLLDRALA